MDILIVEDVETKADKLTKIVGDALTWAKIVRVRSYHSALRVCQEKSFDLMLVDMSIPVFDDDSISDPDALSLGGKNLIDMLGLLGLVVKTIIVSGYERFPYDSGDLDLLDIFEELKKEYGDQMIGCVKYDEASIELVEELRNLLFKTLG